MFRIAAAFLAAVLCVGGLYLYQQMGWPRVTLENLSDETLRNVVLTGDGASWSHRVEDLAPGESTVETIRDFSGESGLRLEFDAAGSRVSKGNLAYLEARGGYRVGIEILPDLELRVDGQL